MTVIVQMKRRGLDEVAGYIWIFLFVVFYFVHIIVHEAGHLLFGVLTGYRFVSFRIGSLTWVKQEGKIVLKRFSIPGTAGQCLLEPPKKNEDDSYASVLYNMGGVIVNGIVAIFSLLLYKVTNCSETVQGILIVCSLAGLFIVLTNGIPLKLSGIANDGYNAFSLKKDALASHAFYTQLDLNARLSKGQRFEEIPKEIVCVSNDADLSNALIATQKIYEYYYYMACGQMEEAKTCLQEFASVWSKLLPLLKNIILIEKIFLETIHDNRAEVIEEYMTKEVKAYMKQAKHDIGVWRTKYARMVFTHQNQDDIDAYETKMRKVIDNYPVLGEVKFNEALIQYVKEVAQTCANREK